MREPQSPGAVPPMTWKRLLRRMLSRFILVALMAVLCFLMMKMQKNRSLSEPVQPQPGREQGAVVVPPGVPHVFNTFVFNTNCQLVLTGPKDECNASARQAMALCRQLNDTLNRFDSASEVSRFNSTPANQDFQCSEMFWQALMAARDAHRKTGGAFDITVAPLLDYWRKGGNGSDAEYQRLRKCTGFDRLVFREESRIIRKSVDGVQLDFGGIAKGLALDMLQKIADAPHIEEALLNLGGNLYLRQKADAPFSGEVAIRSPFGEKTPSATITNCNGRFISTSSAAERGRHILDPISGQPAQSEVSSATAVTECGTDSDVFSTAVFIGGKAMAERLVQNTPGTAFVILTAPGEAPLTMGDIVLKQFSAEKSGNSN